jgi:hypothetical protein
MKTKHNSLQLDMGQTPVLRFMNSAYFSDDRIGFMQYWKQGMKLARDSDLLVAG